MKAEAFVHRDGTGTFTLEDGSVELVRAGTPAAARLEVVRLASLAAAHAACAVDVEALIDGERSLIEVAPDGAVAGTTQLAHAGAPPVAETVARNDEHGLVAAGVRPAQLLDADTLASARLRMVEQAAFGAEQMQPPALVTDSVLVVAAVGGAPTRPPGVRHRRPALLTAGTAAAAVLLLGGTGIAVAAAGHHRQASRRSTMAASTTLTAASASPTASQSATPAKPPFAPLRVEVAGRAGKAVVRVEAAGATAATVRLVPEGAAALERPIALGPDGRATVRLTVPGASYVWSVSTPDGRRQEGQVVIAAASPIPTALPSAPSSSATHHLAPTRHVSARASSRPKPKSTPKPKVHASVPASPLERESA